MHERTLSCRAIYAPGEFPTVATNGRHRSTKLFRGTPARGLQIFVGHNAVADSKLAREVVSSQRPGVMVSRAAEPCSCTQAGRPTQHGLALLHECLRHACLNRLRSEFARQWRERLRCKASRETFNSWLFERLASRAEAGTAG